MELKASADEDVSPQLFAGGEGRSPTQKQTTAEMEWEKADGCPNLSRCWNGKGKGGRPLKIIAGMKRLVGAFPVAVLLYSRYAYYII